MPGRRQQTRPGQSMGHTEAGRNVASARAVADSGDSLSARQDRSKSRVRIAVAVCIRRRSARWNVSGFRQRSRHRVFDGAAQQHRRQPQSETPAGRSPSHVSRAAADICVPRSRHWTFRSTHRCSCSRRRVCRRRQINAANPRALFFTDRVVLGWVRDGEVLEVAAQDATQGVVFYTLDQRATDAPQFKRMTTCLGCHAGGRTLGVPGLLMFTTSPPPTVGRPVGHDGPSEFR